MRAKSQARAKKKRDWAEGLVTPASKVTPEQALKIIDDERERMELEEDPAAAVSGKTA